MIKYIITILLFASFTASAQYIPNSGAYQYKGLKQTNSLQPPTASGAPVTSVNAPDSNYAAWYYRTADTSWYSFNPVTKTWSKFTGGGGSQIRDTAYLNAGWPLKIINPTSPDDSLYKPNGYDVTMMIDSNILGDYIVQIVNNDTSINNNSNDTARFIVDTIANSPPVGATDGYKVLVGAISGNIVVANPTGLFTGHGEEVAELVGAVWNFTVPDNNDQLIVDNANNYSTWQYVNGVWRVTARLVRWSGDRGLGRNSFIGKTDKQPVFFRSWNRIVMQLDTNRNVLIPKWTGLQDSNMFYRPGVGGMVDTGYFRQLIAGTGITITPGLNRTDTISSDGGNLTWQQTLDNGSTLDKDNSVDVDHHSFYMNNIANAQFVGNSLAEPDVLGLLSVGPYGIAMAGSKTNFSSQITATKDSLINEGININGADLWETYMSMTDEYVRFDRKSVNGSPSFSPFPRIIYAPEVMDTPPEFVYVSDNDTIKKYPFSGGGGSSLFPTTGTGTAAGTVIGELAGNSLLVTSSDNSLLIVNPGDNGVILQNSTGTKRVAVSDDIGGISLESDGVININNAYTLPTTDGTANQVLTAHGDNTATWEDAGGGGSMSIGGSITSATAKSVLYAGASGVLAQDNSNFAWDYTNHRLGLGTASPSQLLDINGGKLRLYTSGAQAVTLSNDNYDFIVENGQTAKFRLLPTGSDLWFNNTANGDLVFKTNGSTELVRMSANGYVGIGTGAGYPLEVSGDGPGPKYLLMNLKPSAGASNLSASIGLESRYLSTTQNWFFGSGNGAGNNNFRIYDQTNSIEALDIVPGGSVLVGTATSVSSSKLTVESTTQGFLPPRMTTTQKNAISSPAEGLMVYDLTLHKLYVYDGSTWQAAW